MRSDIDPRVSQFVEKNFPEEMYKPGVDAERVMVEGQLKEMNGLKRAGLLDFFKLEEIILTGVRAYSQRYQRFARVTAPLITATKMKYVGPTIPGIIKAVKVILSEIPDVDPPPSPEPEPITPLPAEVEEEAKDEADTSPIEAQILMDASAKANAAIGSAGAGKGKSPTGSDVPRRVRTGHGEQGSKRPRVYAPENSKGEGEATPPGKKAAFVSSVPQDQKDLFKKVLLNLFEQDRVQSCSLEQIGEAVAEETALSLKSDDMNSILEEMQHNNRVFCAEGTVYMM